MGERGGALRPLARQPILAIEIREGDVAEVFAFDVMRRDSQVTTDGGNVLEMLVAKGTVVCVCLLVGARTHLCGCWARRRTADVIVICRVRTAPLDPRRSCGVRSKHGVMLAELRGG